MIDGNPDWSKKDKIIQSVPGVGEKSSQALIAGLSELGTLNRREVAALVGTALNAIKYCEPLKMFYEKLREKGKSFKVAIVAVMRLCCFFWSDHHTQCHGKNKFLLEVANRKQRKELQNKKTSRSPP